MVLERTPPDHKIDIKSLSAEEYVKQNLAANWGADVEDISDDLVLTGYQVLGVLFDLQKETGKNLDIRRTYFEQGNLRFTVAQCIEIVRKKIEMFSKER